MELAREGAVVEAENGNDAIGQGAQRHHGGKGDAAGEEAAAGMYRVACNNMAQGVREVTIKRGFDPREFPFIPAGGAGPAWRG